MPRSRRILIICGDTPCGRDMVRGIDSYCRVSGRWEYHLEGEKSPESPRRCELAIRQWHAEGMIVQIRTEEIASLVRRSGLPAVHVSGSSAFDMPMVIPDFAAAGRIAAEYFLNAGFSNFAFCSLTPEYSSATISQSFTATLAIHGHVCTVFTDICKTGHETNWVKNRRRMSSWLASLKRPLALLCMNDLRAREVVSECGRLGLRVPEDVAVVGVGNGEFFCRMSSPQISSVDTHSQRIGYAAAELLERLLRGCRPPKGPILVPPRGVVERQSSKTFVVADQDVAEALRYIRDHSQEPICVKELLRLLQLSRKTLERRFEKFVGHTPKQEILRVRLGRVKGLLAEPGISIPAVAKASGFTSAGSFCHFFRRAAGVSPVKYRRERSGRNLAGNAPAAAGELTRAIARIQ